MLTYCLPQPHLDLSHSLIAKKGPTVRPNSGDSERGNPPVEFARADAVGFPRTRDRPNVSAGVRLSESNDLLPDHGAGGFAEPESDLQNEGRSGGPDAAENGRERVRNE